MQSLILLTFAKLSLEDLVRVKSDLPSTDSDWWTWLSVCELNRVQTIVYKNLIKYQIEVPAFVIENLKTVSDQVHQEAIARWKAASPVLSRLNDLNIPWILLKGNAIAEEIYGDIGYKKMNDIDILVGFEDIPGLLEIFSESGFVTAAQIGKDLKKMSKFTHHLSPFADRQLQCVLGTHWNLVSPLRGLNFATECLWDRSVSVSVSGWQARRLGNEDFLLHLCVHLSSYKVGLKELADIYNFLKYFKIDSDGFLKLVNKTGAVVEVYRALTLANLVVPSDVVKPILDLLKNSVPNSVIQELHGFELDPLLILFTRSVQIGRIEKAYALFTLVNHPVEKTHWLLEMWRHLIFPSTEEAFRLCRLRTSGSVWVKIFARIKAPFRIVSIMSQELGWGLFAILMIQHHITLLTSYFNFIKSGLPMAGRLKNVAEQMGVDIRKLELLTSLE